MARRKEPGRKLNISYPEPVHASRGMRISMASGTATAEDGECLLPHALRRPTSSLYTMPQTVRIDGMGHGCDLQRDSIVPSPAQRGILHHGAMASPGRPARRDIALGMGRGGETFATRSSSITIVERHAPPPQEQQSRFSTFSHVARRAGRRVSRAMTPRPLLRYSTVAPHHGKELSGYKHPFRTKALFIVAGVSTGLVVAGIIVTVLVSCNVIGRDLKEKLFHGDEGGQAS